MRSATAYSAFAECSAFYRDAQLSPAIWSMYRVGVLFREPTFCDATYKFGGFAAPHRYLILSANARCLDAIAPHPEWGLCVWQPGRIFKVIGAHRKAARSQVTLLEIPEERRPAFTTPTLSKLERVFSRQAARQFAQALRVPVLPEHNDRLWLDRLVFPLGVDDAGRFFEAWSHNAERGP